LRFFHFAFACLPYPIWRAVDLLVQIELRGEYEHSPIVTADNTLTLLKKETRIGLIAVHSALTPVLGGATLSAIPKIHWDS